MQVKKRKVGVVGGLLGTVAAVTIAASASFAQVTPPPAVVPIGGGIVVVLAVVVAVLSARPRTVVEQPAFSLWARKSRQTRPSVRPGFGAWRASMMPR